MADLITRIINLLFHLTLYNILVKHELRNDGTLQIMPHHVNNILPFVKEIILRA